MGDYLADLESYTAADIDEACKEYRRDVTNKYYPRSAELLAILNPRPSEFDRDRGPRLPKFEGLSPLNGPRATKSVAEVLRENGFDHAANKWQASNTR